MIEIEEEILDKIAPVPTEEEVMSDIKEKLEEQNFAITNFKKGGIFYIIIRIFVTIYVELKQVARDIISNLFIESAEEDWLEVKAGDYGKQRVQAVKTQGYVTITRDSYANAIQITQGHMFKTLPDINGRELKFYALKDTVIGAGEKVGKVLVEAEESGTLYNVSPGTITVSMIHLDGVTDVTNAEDWLYLEGADIEELESFRKRIKESWAELSELPIDDKIKNIAKSVIGVLDVQIDSQHPRGQGTTDIIITGTNGEATQELLNKVKERTSFLQGDHDDFLYKSSTVKKQNVSVVIYIAKDESTDGVEQTARNIIDSVWKLQNRKELNCMYIDDMRYALKSGISNYKSAEFKSPTKDIEYETGVVVVLGSVEVSVRNKGGA